MTHIGECPNRAHDPRLNAGRWTCPQCEAGVQPSSLVVAFAARDAAMVRATEARPTDASRVAAAIRQLAAKGQPFSANDARAIHGIRGGVVGATFNALRTEGVIKAVGSEPSNKKNTHGKDVARWVAADAA